MSIFSNIESFAKYFSLSVISFCELYGSKRQIKLKMALENSFFECFNVFAKNYIKGKKTKEDFTKEFSEEILKVCIVHAKKFQFAIKNICYIFAFYGFVPTFLIQKIKYSKNYLFLGSISRINIEIIKEFPTILNNTHLFFNGFGVKSEKHIEIYKELVEKLSLQEITSLDHVYKLSNEFILYSHTRC